MENNRKPSKGWVVRIASLFLRHSWRLAVGWGSITEERMEEGVMQLPERGTFGKEQGWLGEIGYLLFLVCTEWTLFRSHVLIS